MNRRHRRNIRQHRHRLAASAGARVRSYRPRGHRRSIAQYGRGVKTCQAWFARFVTVGQRVLRGRLSGSQNI